MLPEFPGNAVFSTEASTITAAIAFPFLPAPSPCSPRTTLSVHLLAPASPEGKVVSFTPVGQVHDLKDPCFVRQYSDPFIH